MVFSPSTITLISPPNTATQFQVTATPTNEAAFNGVTSLYAVIVDPAGLISNNVQLTPTGSNGGYTATLSLSANDVPGIFTGNLTLHLCTNSQCTAEISGSPWSVPYQFTLTAAYYQAPLAIAVDTNDNLYVADTFEGVGMVTHAGVASVVTPKVTGSPEGIAVDPSNNAWVNLDNINETGFLFYKVSSSGAVSNYNPPGGMAGSYMYAEGLAFDSAGNLFFAYPGLNNSNISVINFTNQAVSTVYTGAALNIACASVCPLGMVVDSAENVYLSSPNNNTIYKVTPAGVLTVFAGGNGVGSTDGAGSAAQFSSPQGLAIDSAGNIYVADSGNNTIRLISISGMVSTLAGTAGVTGAVDATGSAASFSSPHGVAVDSTGNLYVIDSGNKIIRKIAPGGVVTTVIASAQ